MRYANICHTYLHIKSDTLSLDVGFNIQMNLPRVLCLGLGKHTNPHPSPTSDLFFRWQDVLNVLLQGSVWSHNKTQNRFSLSVMERKRIHKSSTMGLDHPCLLLTHLHILIKSIKQGLFFQHAIVSFPALDLAESISKTYPLPILDG